MYDPHPHVLLHQTTYMIKVYTREGGCHHFSRIHKLYIALLHPLSHSCALSLSTLTPLAIHKRTHGQKPRNALPTHSRHTPPMELSSIVKLILFSHIQGTKVIQ